MSVDRICLAHLSIFCPGKKETVSMPVQYLMDDLKFVGYGPSNGCEDYCTYCTACIRWVNQYLLSHVGESLHGHTLFPLQPDTPAQSDPHT